MRKKQIFRRLAAALLCLTLMAPCLLHGAWADGPAQCSLQLSYTPGERPMAGVSFRVYRVADLDTETVSYQPTEPYASYNVLTAPGTWETRAATLAAYVSRDQLPADFEAETDPSGGLHFDALPSGLYLITGSPSYRDGYLYTTKPVLLSLPYLELTEDGYIWTEHVSAYVKYTYSAPGGSTVQRHAIKVWDDEGNEESRPAQVTVDLLQNGTVYATTVLSADNNWRCDWTDLPDGFDYQVAERSPGEDYTVSVSQTGITFVITNTYSEEIPDDKPPLIDKPDKPGDGDDPGETDIGEDGPPLDNLPQTGLLWWPVPLLVIAGGVMLFLGGIQRRRGAYEEEE